LRLKWTLLVISRFHFQIQTVTGIKQSQFRYFTTRNKGIKFSAEHWNQHRKWMPWLLDPQHVQCNLIYFLAFKTELKREKNFKNVFFIIHIKHFLTFNILTKEMHYVIYSTTQSQHTLHVNGQLLHASSTKCRHQGV